MTLTNAATDLMVKYAAYHRDRRNIVTHFVGIPMIVFAVGVLLARPTFTFAGMTLAPAVLAWVLATLWYLSKGNVVLALAVSAVNGALIAAALPLGQGPTFAWLSWGVGAFVLGWFIQFVGHYYEGKKPAFVDDIRGLMVGPMFVTAEAMFALGWGKPLLALIESRVGPTHIRDLHSAP
jgi:uncharacterized membrane protein YGL010W